MSMNSEENQKVGKLFEDTKYTGLIAKLKTDGIPGSQANMVTVTLPSPATACIIPPSVSSTVVPPSATAGPVQPVSAGSSAPGAQTRVQAQAAPARVTPVKANTVPVAVSTTSANVVSVPKEVPMKSVTYEWAPPVANKFLVRNYFHSMPCFVALVCKCIWAWAAGQLIVLLLLLADVQHHFLPQGGAAEIASAVLSFNFCFRSH